MYLFIFCIIIFFYLFIIILFYKFILHFCIQFYLLLHVGNPDDIMLICLYMVVVVKGTVLGGKNHSTITYFIVHGRIFFLKCVYNDMMESKWQKFYPFKNYPFKNLTF